MSGHIGWQRDQPSARLSLGNDEVHVWQTGLELAHAPVTQFLHTLSPDECERTARFHFERDRVHFVVARGVLRALLSAYVGAPPATLRFSYGTYGKPTLEDDATLNFNVTHSGELALYAVARNREVGIDVERVREDIQCDAIAKQFFSPVECAALAQLPPPQRSSAFFRCWTRKEAYVKAHGMGLSLPLDQFDVTLAPDLPAQILCTRHDPGDAVRWSMAHLDLADGYAAALVAKGWGWNIICREYAPA